MINRLLQKLGIKNPAAQVAWEMVVPMLNLNHAQFDKAFFHIHKGGWKWIVPLKTGGAIVFPVNPETPVTVLNATALQSDLKEFNVEVGEQKQAEITKQTATQAAISKLMER